MIRPPPPTVTISHEDLLVAAHAMLLRLPLRSPETRRVARIRELLEVSAELSRALRAHVHCGSVQCQGSYGAGDLVAETEILYETFAHFGALVHEIAADYRKVVDGTVEPVLDVPVMLPAAPLPTPSIAVA
jgi:hypothetical protein